MRRKLLLGLSIILVASGLFLLVKVIYSFRDIEKGGLQVTSNMKGRVLLDGKEIGIIPVRKTSSPDTIPVGNYELRIEPEDTTLASYTARVRINGGVLTAVDKTFLPGSLGSAYTLTLEKSQNPKPKIDITSVPSGALVTVDSVAVGSTPYTSGSLSASEHEIEIQKEGFSKKTIRVRTVDRHTLVVSVALGTGDIGTVQIPTDITPTSSITLTPTPLTAVAATITILPTPNGFLRVRGGPSTSFGEVARVKPGETYTVLTEENGWYEIQAEGVNGWISSQFARKN